MNDTIFIDIYDVGNLGYINMIIELDEFAITTCQKNFWKCINWLKKEDDNYKCDRNTFYFYPKQYGSSGIFYLFFQINSINEINSEGIEVNSTFYTLDQINTSFSLHYQEDELELINFNNTNNFYITDNKTLDVIIKIIILKSIIQ